MTQRKPWDLSFDSWIDVQIREAEARGMFEDLGGAGKPQRSLGEASDPLWWAKQFLRREEVSVLPPAIEVRVRAQKLREVLASLPSERAVREAAEALNADIRRVNRTAVDGPPTTQAPLDPDALVAAWRAAQTERGPARDDARPRGSALSLDAREGDDATNERERKRRPLLALRLAQRRTR